MNGVAPHEEPARAADPAPTGFWRSQTGICLIVALLLAGSLLGYELSIQLLGSDWLLYLPLLICVAMHFLMHGGHGGHGGKNAGSGQT